MHRAIKLLRRGSDSRGTSRAGGSAKGQDFIFKSPRGVNRDSQRFGPAARRPSFTVEAMEGRIFLSALAPDPTFGTNGYSTLIEPTGKGSQIASVVAEPNGDVVEAGETAEGGSNPLAYVCRFEADGAPDTNFNKNAAKLSFGSFDGSYFRHAVVQPDGKILVSGYVVQGLEVYAAIVARFDSDGTPDKTFQGSGYRLWYYVRASDGSHEDAVAGGIGVLPNGNIVLEFGVDFGNIGVIGLVAFNPAGNLASNFGDAGDNVGDTAATTRIVDGTGVNPLSLAVGSTGDITVTGEYTTATGDSPPQYGFVARFSDAGLPDASFDKDGTYTPTLHSDPLAVAVDPSGRAIINGGGYLERFTAAGELDLSFGNNGTVDIPLFSVDLAIQGNGDLLVTGVNNVDRVVLEQLTGSGSPDLTAGPSGTLTLTDFDGIDPTHVVIDGGGAILVGGTAQELNPVVARFVLEPGTLSVTPPTGWEGVAGDSTLFPLGSFTESYAPGNYTVDVIWGDGGSNTYTQTAAGTITSEPHTYAKVGTDTISVKITDSQGETSNTATYTAYSVTTLSPQYASMSGGTGTAMPEDGLIFDSAGNLYGTTEAGGSKHDGAVFKIADKTHTITTLASFSGANGDEPAASLYMDSAGDLFGTTLLGGKYNDGSVFEIVAGRTTVTTLESFDGTDGSDPAGSLTPDAAGNLYGTTSEGGASKVGTVFKIAAGTHAFSTMVSFGGGASGATPAAGLVADGSGNLYGTTKYGGYGVGTVFEIAAGTKAVDLLAEFDRTNGSVPVGSLIIGSQGNLYGTTEYGGGTTNEGTVFEVAGATHAIIDLAVFAGSNGAFPLGDLVADAAGNLYGTTSGGGYENLGTVFKIAAGTHALTLLTAFDGTNGANPSAGLTVDRSGDLFGTTAGGGAGGSGTVFEVSGFGFASGIAISPPATQTAIVGLSTKFSLGSFVPLAATGPYTVIVNWDDGSSNTKFTQSSAGFIIAKSHTYANAAFYVITLSVTGAGSVKSVVDFYANVVASLTPEYTITDLTTGGLSGSIAHGLNDSGDVIGELDGAGGAQYPFVWTLQSGMQQIADAYGVAYGINNAGVIVGAGAVQTGEFPPSGGFIASALHPSSGIGVVFDTADGALYGVNNSFIGLAVGQDDFTNSSGQTVIHAAFYNGDTYDTGTLGDNTDPNVTSVSYGIADYGNSTGIGAVGSSSVSNGDTHAFVQEPDGSLLDVGTLTGTKGNSAALGVNPAGTDVVGYAPFSDTSAAPFVYSPATGKMTEIKVPSSTAIQTQANAVNNSGVVVGSYGTAYLSGGLHLAETAFIRLAKGTVQNLNNEIAPGTGWDLESATGINSSGQICGYGTIDGQTHAFLLTPVTAPAKP